MVSLVFRQEDKQEDKMTPVKKTIHKCWNPDCDSENPYTDLCVTRYKNGRLKSVMCSGCHADKIGTMPFLPDGRVHPKIRQRRKEIREEYKCRCDTAL